MTKLYERLAGLNALVGVMALVLGLAAVPEAMAASATPCYAIMGENGIESIVCIVAATGDDTCNNGKIGDANPCVTSATGSCTKAVGAPAGVTCSGCGFATIPDATGKVIGCAHNCSATGTGALGF